MSFSAQTALLLVLVGVAVGAFGTLVGAGGGFILTPVLLLLYPHDSPKLLTAISLLAVFFNAASGSVAYARQRRTDFRSGAVFGLATVPGAIAGALLVGRVSRGVFDPLMGATLAALAIWLVAGGRRAQSAPAQGGPAPSPRARRLSSAPATVHRELLDAAGNRFSYDVPLLRGALYSLGVGFFSSFLGIGGGVIHVPLLVRALGFPTHVATATSHLVLAIMAGTGTLTHVLAGTFVHGHGLRRGASLAVGVVVGAQLGARLSLRLDARVIQWLLAAALSALSLRLLVAG